MDHDEFVAALDRIADEGPSRRPCWRMPSPPSDPQARSGDWQRAVWLLDEAHQALRRAMALQRRKRLVCEDPLDGMDLRAAAERVEVAARDLDMSLLDGPPPGVADLYMQAVQDAADALLEADRLERARTPDDYHRPSLQALFNRHLAGTERAPVLMSLAYWLLAPGVEPGVALGVLEGWDQARCHPPLGSDEVERLVLHVAGRLADRLEGRAA